MPPAPGPFTLPCSHPSARRHLPLEPVCRCRLPRRPFRGVLASFPRSPAAALSVSFSEKLQPEGGAFSCRPVTALFALGTYSVPPELCRVGICKLRGSWPANQRAPWVPGAAFSLRTAQYEARATGAGSPRSEQGWGGARSVRPGGCCPRRALRGLGGSRPSPGPAGAASLKSEPWACVQ